MSLRFPILQKFKVMNQLKYISLTLVFVFIVLIAKPVLAEDTPLWKEFLAAKANKTEYLLPDFSYAGYQHGEVPIPQVTGPIFKVSDYGAVPNDEQNDSEAIQKAVDAAGDAGGGVVLFEKGIYLINTEEASATNARVTLKKKWSHPSGSWDGRR